MPLPGIQVLPDGILSRPTKREDWLTIARLKIESFPVRQQKHIMLVAKPGFVLETAGPVLMVSNRQLLTKTSQACHFLN
jgi:hypothetical protein